jgi:hypothetical protein
MLTRQEGLTATKTDSTTGGGASDIAELRSLHVEMDPPSPPPTAGPTSNWATASTRRALVLRYRSASQHAAWSSPALLRLNTAPRGGGRRGLPRQKSPGASAPALRPRLRPAEQLDLFDYGSPKQKRLF